MPRLVKSRKVITLLSGGIDSAACVNYYLKGKFYVKAFFIDYGQAASKNEYKSAKKIANHYNIRLDTAKAFMYNKFRKGEIMGRNAFFVMIALMKYPTFSGIISLGIHDGVPYYDTTKLFLKDIRNIVNGYTDGRVQIDAPFLKWQKYMIYDYCKRNNVPVDLTYSCELGKNPPCGKCRSCLDRKILNVG